MIVKPDQPERPRSKIKINSKTGCIFVKDEGFKSGKVPSDFTQEVVIETWDYVPGLLIFGRSVNVQGLKICGMKRFFQLHVMLSVKPSRQLNGPERLGPETPEYRIEV